MRDLPILSIRDEGNSTISEHPKAVDFLRGLRSAIGTEPSIRGDLISSRIERLSDGCEFGMSLRSGSSMEMRLAKQGRTLVLRSPDPFMTGSSSRSMEGDLPNTVAALLEMAMRTIDADLIPDAERDALDEIRFSRARAIAARVSGANERISQVMVRPPGPFDDALHVSADRDSEDACVPLDPAHMAWMPLRCTGIGVVNTVSGVIVTFRNYAGSITMPTPTDPLMRMREIAECIELPPAPEPVIPESAWEAVF